MANKKLPGGRKPTGRITTSAAKLISLKSGTAGVAISELPAAEKLSGIERFPVVQDNETRGANVGQITDLIPAGVPGASAYDIWVSAQPEGADVSEAAYLAFQKGKRGKDGIDGKDGLTAYQIWAEAQPEGADTSEDAYLVSMQGMPGKDGEDGVDGLSAYQIWAAAQEEGADTSEEAYIEFQSGKTGKNGEDGKSAYETWLDAGHKGTEEEFLEWLRESTAILDPAATNILKENEAGLHVNGAHPIIPKFSSGSANGTLEKRFELDGGAMIFDLTATLSNPLKITALGGVALYRIIVPEPKYYLVDSDNKLIATQLYLVGSTLSSSSVTANFKLFTSALPDKVYDLNTNELIANADSGPLPYKVTVQMIIGTTLTQNGFN